jgi:perosamine synthetase
MAKSRLGLGNMKRDTLALYGGKPIRKNVIYYGRQWIEEDDIRAVVEALNDDLITTGPRAGAFEEMFADYVGSKEAVVVSNGTAALHAAMYAAGIKDGDEVIVPAMTFAASANCVVFQGGKPIFADVKDDTLLIDPEDVISKITDRTRAIIPVDYTGQPCDYDWLNEIAEKYDLMIVADACHSPGGKYKGRNVGTLADMSVFSFHPVKHLTSGEGGMVTTDDSEWARKLRMFRTHGITTDHALREERGTWFYEMVDLGYNYRITDFQCALGMSQLKKLPDRVSRRREIAAQYDDIFHALPGIDPLKVLEGVSHAYHLYVVRLDTNYLDADRPTIFQAFWAEGVGVHVHYIPVHLHPFYQREFGTQKGLCPNAEAAYEGILTIPLYPSMTDEEVGDVIAAAEKVIRAFLK